MNWINIGYWICDNQSNEHVQTKKIEEAPNNV